MSLIVPEDAFYYNRVNALAILGEKLLVASSMRGVQEYPLAEIINGDAPKGVNFKDKYGKLVHAFDLLCRDDVVVAARDTGELLAWRQDNPHRPAVSLPLVKSSINRLTAPSDHAIVAGSESGKLTSLEPDSSGGLTPVAEAEVRGSVLDLKAADDVVWAVGEMGIVHRWDRRVSKVDKLLTPNEIPALQRKDYGRWLGCVALSDNWLATGGGPRLAVFDQRSLDVPVCTPSTADDLAPAVACFDTTGDRLDLVTAGWSKREQIYRLGLREGQEPLLIRTSMVPIQALEIKHEPYRLMVAAGNADAVNIYVNFNYVARTFTLA